MCNSRIQSDFRGRRGAGIELALILILVVVAFSGLLTSTVVLQSNKLKSSTEQLDLLQQRAVLDQIGEEFCSCSPRAGYTLSAELELVYDTTPTETSLIVCLEGTTDPVLTVALTANDDGTYTVTQWSYG